MRKKLAAIIVASIITAWAVPVLACTIFNASTEDIVLVGNNEDYHERDTKVWFIPRTEDQYGAIIFGFSNLWGDGGMNDQGLFYDWVASAYDPLPPSPDKKTFDGNLSIEILKHCATVDEALAYFDEYNQPSFGYASMMLVDKTGDSAIVGWDKSKNQLDVQRKEGNYQIMGYGSHIIPKTTLETNCKHPSVENFTAMLSRARMNYNVNITVYSNVCDLKNGKVYLYYLGDFDRCIEFDLEEELEKGSHLYDMKTLFDQYQDVSAEESEPPADQTDSDPDNIVTDAGHEEAQEQMKPLLPILYVSVGVILCAVVLCLYFLRKRAGKSK